MRKQAKRVRYIATASDRDCSGILLKIERGSKIFKRYSGKPGPKVSPIIKKIKIFPLTEQIRPLTFFLLTTHLFFFYLCIINQKKIKKIMTRHEFETRTGKKVTLLEFDKIESVYLNLPLMSKDDFIEHWQKVEFNPIVIELSDYISILIKKIADLKVQIKKYEDYEKVRENY